MLNRIIPQIQCGPGRLVLNESFLVDTHHTSFIDIPTIKGVPFRIQFKFQDVALGHSGEYQVTKFDANILELLFTYPALGLASVGTKHWADVFIAGQACKFLIHLTRLLDNCCRVEFTIYET